MKNAKIHLGYDIFMERGPVLRPTRFKLWKPNHFQNSKVPARAPLKYQADALLAFAYMRLHPQNGHGDSDQCVNFWHEIEPHLSLFNEARGRVKAMAKLGPSMPHNTIKNFEKNFMEKLHSCFHGEVFDLKELTALVETIHRFETDMKTPLLYNFYCEFTPEFTEVLQALDSFLFHLRNLVAIDFNNHIDDSSHEAIKMDSVTDYLPKGDYVVSDAVLYWQVKKLTAQFSTGVHSDVRVDKLLVQPLESAFKQYAHNACYLIDHLPESFLDGLNAMEMEDALYLVQMDWLLGTGTGMLFKIREELYGLQDGFEKIFWPEIETRSPLKSAHLSLHLQFSANEILGVQKAG